MAASRKLVGLSRQRNDDVPKESKLAGRLCQSAGAHEEVCKSAI